MDLDIEDGEFVVLVGPSGCGKTTALRMIAGLESSTSGQITITGLDVTHQRPGLRNCAMVFQNYALYPHMNVAANICYGMKIRRTPKAEMEIAVERVSDILGLSELLHRRPKDLSGGQRQRVAIGRALVREPEVFLFDEPLSNLDAKLRVEMRTEIKKLHQRLGATMIYVTHDQIEAMTLADRVVVMRAGIIEQADTPIELYEKPANMFVASFIGAPSMNFLAGKLEHKKSAVSISVMGIHLPKLSTEQQQRLTELKTDQITVGIRPEHIGGLSNKKTDLPMTVEAIETLGSHKLLLGLVDGKQFVAQVNAHDQSKPGDTVRLQFNSQRFHLFDPETELTL